MSPISSSPCVLSCPKNIITSSGVFLKSPEKENSADGEKIRTYIFFSPISETKETSVQKASAALQEEINKGRKLDFSMDNLGTQLKTKPSLIRHGNTLSLGKPTVDQQDLRQDQRDLQLNQRIVQQDQINQQLKQDSQQLKQDSQQRKQDSQQRKQDSQQLKQDRLQIAEGIQKNAQGTEKLEQDTKENKKLLYTAFVNRPGIFEDLKNLFISVVTVLKFTVQFIFCNRVFKFLYHWFSNFFRRSPAQSKIQ